MKPEGDGARTLDEPPVFDDDTEELNEKPNGAVFDVDDPDKDATGAASSGVNGATKVHKGVGALTDKGG